MGQSKAGLAGVGQYLYCCFTEVGDNVLHFPGVNWVQTWTKTVNF